jgi:hypothetical protein
LSWIARKAAVSTPFNKPSAADILGYEIILHARISSLRHPPERSGFCVNEQADGASFFKSLNPSWTSETD